MPLAECDRPAEMQLRKFCKAALDVQRGTGAIYEPWIRSAAGQLLLRFSKDARAKACDGIFPDWCSHDLVQEMFGGDMSGLPPVDTSTAAACGPAPAASGDIVLRAKNRWLTQDRARLVRDPLLPNSFFNRQAPFNRGRS